MMFEYKVLDNFLDDHDFNYLNNIKLAQIDKIKLKFTKIKFLIMEKYYQITFLTNLQNL